MLEAQFRGETQSERASLVGSEGGVASKPLRYPNVWSDEKAN
jgi:hypothetical protein